MYDSISDFTVSLNVGVVHVLSLDAPSCVWRLYEYCIKIYGVPLPMDFSPVKSHKLLVPLVKDGDGGDVSENYSQGLISCEFFLVLYVCQKLCV